LRSQWAGRRKGVRSAGLLLAQRHNPAKQWRLHVQLAGAGALLLEREPKATVNIRSRLPNPRGPSGGATPEFPKYRSTIHHARISSGQSRRIYKTPNIWYQPDLNPLRKQSVRITQFFSLHSSDHGGPQHSNQDPTRQRLITHKAPLTFKRLPSVQHHHSKV